VGLLNCCKLLAASMCAFLLAMPAISQNRPAVMTQQGKVEGKMSPDGGVREFLGIPYAVPPLGPLRWKPPQPGLKWRRVRSTTSFGAHCMQPTIYADMIFRDPGQSEDCLTLNVWTPAKAKGAKLPVMVWIHGGGLPGGSSEPRQDGEHLAHKGVLVVSMNYRLGIFGFFALPALAKESPRHAAGNYGLMDQIAALQWVHRNIAAFGGDPENVTIFGESFGSISASVLLASPLTKGLFARAIGESGGAFTNFSPTPQIVAQRQDQDFAQAAFGNSNLASLRQVSAAELLKASTAKTTGDDTIFVPDVDGDVLPESVEAIYAGGKQAHVPLLAGWNKDEGGTVDPAERPALESLKEMASKQFGSRSGEFLDAYAASTDAEAVRVLEDYAGDAFIAHSTWAWLEAQVKTGNAPVFHYHFDLGSPGDPNHPASIGVFHSDDIEYVFGNLDSRKGAHWRPEDYQLSELMQNYWINFARTGNPNGPNLPDWPGYNAAGKWQVMHLSPDAKAEPDQHRDRYLFLQQVWEK